MKAKQIGAAHGERTFAVIFNTGDEVKAGLLAFARDQRLAGSHFTAIGAFSEVTLSELENALPPPARISRATTSAGPAEPSSSP